MRCTVDDKLFNVRRAPVFGLYDVQVPPLPGLLLSKSDRHMFCNNSTWAVQLVNALGDTSEWVINIRLRWVCTENIDVIGARYSEISLPIVLYWFLKVNFIVILGGK